MEPPNIYNDAKRAEAYSKIEFHGTYYLAYRDLPEIITRHVRGRNALDFGCGAGRSTRLLKKLGFSVVGVDIAEDMLKIAKDLDPKGDYRLIRDGDFSQFAAGSFDLVLSAFTFDNVGADKKVTNLAGLRALLKPDGKLINLITSPETYTLEWATLSTRDFPENKHAKSGDEVKIIVTDIEDKRPFTDVFWTSESYRETYKRAGLELVKTYRPLAKGNEPYVWVNETKIPPWTIYVLKKPGPLPTAHVHKQS